MEQMFYNEIPDTNTVKFVEKWKNLVYDKDKFIVVEGK